MADETDQKTQASLNKRACERRRPTKPSVRSATGRNGAALTFRLWSVRHSRALEWFYARFADAFLMLHPMWKAIGYQRAEGPVQFVEEARQGLPLRPAECAASACCHRTGMSCLMNCPKQLRNGPAAAFAPRATARSSPDMPCVWVQAWSGAHQMNGRDMILNVQKPVDQSLRETLLLSYGSPPTQPPPANRRQSRRRAMSQAPMPIRLIPPRPSSRCPATRPTNGSNAILRRGEFAVTAELNPPDSANPHDVYERAAIFRRLGRRHQ